MAAAAATAKENVRVVVRGRLPPGQEATAQWAVNGNCLQRDDAGAFAVDRVYLPSASNDEVFSDTRTIVDGVLAGISGAIFAYGVRAPPPEGATAGPADTRGTLSARTRVRSRSRRRLLTAPPVSAPTRLGHTAPRLARAQQTGAGKTHTMRGTATDAGIVPRSVRLPAAHPPATARPHSPHIALAAACLRWSAC